ncbi:asparaginase [Agrococcus versicolor]|uniref:Asparaginase n=1 Tax=Agrococcus versicolor TaxID=501482 RepID=A0ABP5M9U0_9MICO
MRTHPEPPRHVPLVHVTRGAIVESVHHGSVVAIDASGRSALVHGDAATPVYPRSSLKPLQATAMVRAGLDLPPRLLALAGASHSGAAMHREGARAILAIHGVPEEALRNAVDLPLGAAEREAWLREGGERTRIAQNCSGKHAAMLATCAVNGWDLEGYLLPQHPLQLAIRVAVAELSSEEPDASTADGCGTPLWAISLAGLARAFARIVSSPEGTPERRVADAMRAHPDMVGGDGRDVTDLMLHVPGLLAKDGAEGVYAAALPDGRAVALKIADGSERARLPVLLDALASLGVDASGVQRPAPVLGGGQPVGELLLAPSATRPVR